MSHAAAVLTALALAGAWARPLEAQDRDLAVLDAFCCAGASTPLETHQPERDVDGGWSAAPDAPVVADGALRFSGSPSERAVITGPPGARTVHARLRHPPLPVADTTRFVLYARYAGPDDHLAVELSFHPGLISTFVDVYATADGVRTRLHTFSYTFGTAARDVEVAVHDDRASLSVFHDGRALGTHPSDAHSGADALGLSASGPAPLEVRHLAVTTPRPVGAACHGLEGRPARSCLRDSYAPIRTATYDGARDHLFAWAAAGPPAAQSHPVTGLYGGATALASANDPRSPREQAQAVGFNTEHVWPRSRGTQRGTSTDGDAHNDLHHLAAAYGPLNSARSNRPFGDRADAETETRTWYRDTGSRDGDGGAPDDPHLWSRVARDFLRTPDDGDGHLSVAEMGRFDVRHEVRGDVARMAAYVLTLYEIEVQDGDEGEAFVDATLDVLLRWHRQDPVSDAERERDRRILVFQGNANPFVWDSSLVERALYRGDGAPPVGDVWINEVHHSNAGADLDEGVEVAGPAGTDLYGWRIWTYSGNGEPYTAAGAAGGAATLREVVDDEGGGLGAVWVPLGRLRGGCQGLALVAPGGAVAQFLSYGGCRFNAIAGPVFDRAAAAGASSPSHPDSLVWSTPIRGPGRRPVQEWSRLPAGASVQLTGLGRAYPDFTWGGPLPASPGRLNDYQAPAGGVNAVSGGAGAEAPPGALTPRPRPRRDPGGHVAVGLAAPNPSRHRVRLTVGAPPGTEVTATLHDALGRLVARLRPVDGELVIDVSSLRPGSYVVRVSADLLDPVTRTLTVAR